MRSDLYLLLCQFVRPLKQVFCQAPISPQGPTQLRREEVREKVGFSASKIIFNITTEGSDDRLIDKQKIDANRLLLKGKGEF